LAPLEVGANEVRSLNFGSVPVFAEWFWVEMAVLAPKRSIQLN